MKSQLHTHFSTSLLLPIDVSDLSFGRFFFEMLQSNYPWLMPRKYGLTEPLKNIFDGDIDKMLSTSWKDGFTWKLQEKGTEALWSFSFFFRNQWIHSALHIYGNPKKFRIADIKSFYCELMTHGSADIGHIHIISDIEVNRNKQHHNETTWALNTGYTTLELMKYIPNLAWGMLFGKPYIEMMGLEKLLNAPAFLVEKWHDGVYIQITENIEDTYKNYEEFDKKRMQIKEYFGRQYFFLPDLPKSEYRVPNFDFSACEHLIKKK